MNEHLKNATKSIIFESPNATIYRVPKGDAEYPLEQEISGSSQSVVVVFVSENSKIIPIDNEISLLSAILRNDIEKTASMLVQGTEVFKKLSPVYIGRLIADPAVAKHTTHIYACKTKEEDAPNIKHCQMGLVGLLAGRYAIHKLK